MLFSAMMTLFLKISIKIRQKCTVRCRFTSSMRLAAPKRQIKKQIVTIPGMYSTGDYPFYLWENLEADTKYSFVVSACNGFTRECGSPSRHVEATTEDGLSSQVSKVNNPKWG